MEPMFSHSVLTKGARLLRDRSVYATGIPGLFTVAGTHGGYVVTVSDDRTVTTCTCPHGQFHANRAHCSHVAAALLSLRDDADELPVLDLDLPGGTP